MYNNGQHEDPSAIMRRITAQQEEMQHLPQLPSPPRSDYDTSSMSQSRDSSAMSVVRRKGRRNTPKSSNGYNSTVIEQHHSKTSVDGGRRILSPLKPNTQQAHMAKKDMPLARKLYKVVASSPSSSVSPSSAKTAHRVSSSTGANNNNNNKPASTPIRAAHVAQSPHSHNTSMNNSVSINKSLDASQTRSLNISRDLEQELQEMDNSDLLHNDSQESSKAQYQEEEEDDNATPIPRQVGRFTSNTFPSPIPEEAEDEKQLEQQRQEESSESDALPDLPSFQASSPAIAASPAVIADDAHVAVRKRITKRRTVSGPNAQDQQYSPSSSTNGVPPAVTPASTVYSTPGVGRRLLSAEGRFSSSFSGNDISSRAHLPSSSELTETPKHPSSSSSSTSPHTGVSSSAYPSPSINNHNDHNFATPRQPSSSSDADLERRKTHLLSTLRLTALRSVSKPNKYLKRATPYHHTHNNNVRRARSVTPALLVNGQEESMLQQDGESDGDGFISHQMNDNEQDVTSTSTLSSSSSHDLTTHPRGTGNTSLPLVGAGVTGGISNTGAGGTRFNGAKLNNYLHTLNTHLTKENQNLVESLKETQNQVERLLKAAAADRNEEDAEEGSEGDGDVTREMLENHQKTRDDIKQMRNYLSRGLGGGEAGEDSRIDAESKKDEQINHLEQELGILRKQMSEKDSEVQSLRTQVLDNGEEGQTTSDLQKQIFSLQDELSSARSENTSLQTSLETSQQKLLETTTRHTSILSSFQSRTDDLLLQLQEKDSEIEKLKHELDDKEDGFERKMRDLEEELCKVMEEQEENMRVLKRENERFKTENARLDDEKNEMEKQVHEAKRKVDQLEQEKHKLENLLEKASAAPTTASCTSSSATRRVDLEKQNTILHDRINLLTDDIKALENDLKAKEEDLEVNRASSAEAASKHSLAVLDFEDLLSSKDTQISNLEHKLSSTTSSLQNTEAALLSSQQDYSTASSQIVSLRIQLEEEQANYSRLQQKYANSSIAFDNELQKKLDLANREIGNLKFQLANPAPSSSSSSSSAAGAPSSGGRNSSADAKEIEIRTLKSSNHELETRVNQLRRQAIANNMMMLVTPVKRNGNTSGITPEKSVRFDTVKSMKTPRSASMILGNLSLDKTGGTDGNLTVAALYVEIDNLQDQIKNLRGFLEEANEDVDDKLKKLDRAGINTITLAEKLEEAHLRIRELENQLESGRRGGDKTDRGGSEKVIKELRGVKEQLAKERGSLLKELSDIKQHCQHISAQLDASRSAQDKTLRELDFQTAETNRLRHKVNSQSQSHSIMLAEDRNMLMNGVHALQNDLERVQNEAKAIGQDLRLVKSGAQIGLKQPFGTMTCTRTSCLEAANLHKQQAKGLLVQIQYLKACFSRESWFRADLAQQKLYLQAEIKQKQKSIDMTNATLTRFGMPPTPMKTRKIHTLKSVASAVLFTTKMSRLSKEWAKQTALRASIKEAYKQIRGKPLQT